MEKIFSFLIGVGFQLVVSTWLFVMKSPRRKCFLPRFALLLSVGIGSFIADLFRLPFFEFASGMSLAYPLYCFIVAFLIFFCYDIKFSQSVFYAVCGYLVQNLQFNLRVILIILFFPDMNGVLYYLLSSGIILAVLTAVYFLFIYKNRNTVIKENNVFLVIFGIFVLFVVWILSSYAVDEYDRNVKIAIYAALLDVALLVILLWDFMKGKLQRENEIVKQMMELQKKQQKMSKESIEIINIKCHDLKHRLINDLDETNRKEINDAIKIYEKITDTGSETLDILITEKSLFMESKNIEFSYIINGGILSFIDPTDLYFLFANILDNAIEAEEKAENKAQRFIYLKVERVGQMISIIEENFSPVPLVMEDGLPLTTKEDTTRHGYGTKSIRYIVKKYNGTLCYRQENNRVALSILFPFVGREKKQK